MNEARRKELREIMHNMEEANRALGNVIADEEEALDAIPENLQGTDRYQNSEEAVDLMSDAQSSIEDAIEAIDDVLSL
jgi:hypothetical protein